jgi:L-asparaginase
LTRGKVYIANTGGTIGMRRGPRGYTPAPGFLAERMTAMPELRGPEMPAFVVHEYPTLLDSANVRPADWVAVGRDLLANYDRYDGFVVIHGTDTMAFSAAALSFLIEGLDKPVIFTGSQIPLVEVRSDGRENLITSMLIAARQPIPEVCLFFGDRLFRGNRATKVSAGGFDAFDSPNFPPLGEVGVDIELRLDLVRRPGLGEVAEAGGEPARPRLAEPAPAEIAVLKLFPGISARVVERVLEPPVAGAVLETYGVGNAPEDPALLAALEAACRRGVAVVNCTQCLRGGVDMGDYVTGGGLRRAGVVGGVDMTTEAAVAKLYYLLGRGLDAGEVRRQIRLDLRGELTA